MKYQLNENNEIRNSLNKIRKLLNEDQRSNQYRDVVFDDIETKGHLINNGIEQEKETTVVSSIGEFLKNSGLLLEHVFITLDSNRIVITSEHIKNPELVSIKAISFDTNQEYPLITFIDTQTELSDEFVNLLSLIGRTYKDNNIGRNKLITVS